MSPLTLGDACLNFALPDCVFSGLGGFASGCPWRFLVLAGFILGLLLMRHHLGGSDSCVFIYRRHLVPFACVLVCLMWTDSERSCPVCYYCLAQCPLCPVFLLCFRTVVGFSRWYGLPSFFPLRLGILWEVCWGCLSSLGGQVRVSVCSSLLCSIHCFVIS